MAAGGAPGPGSEDFRGRLRRLRRAPAAASDTAAGESAGESTPPALPAWLRARLGSRRAAAAVPAGPERSSGEPRDLAEHQGPRGAFAARVTCFGPASDHGCFRLAEVDHAERDVFRLLTGDAALDALDPRTAVYLDIETTGLSGGAGTTPFMIGLGRFDGAQFELWQGFLREPDEEPALLAECARRVAAASGVVSFFGKSFDRHRLEDKMRMHRVPPPFTDRPHLDLYHPLRRLYAGALADGRLQTMERSLCGVGRADDLPGSFAPAAWFDFLCGRPHLLEDVFRHNLDDVLSLVALYAHLGRTLAERRADGAPLEAAADLRAERAAALAQLFVKRRRFAEGLAWSRRALERIAAGGRRREAALLEAECLRRLGRAEEAFAAFAKLGAERDGHAPVALFAAAKLADSDDVALPLLDRALDLARVFDPRLVAAIDRRRRRTAARLGAG